MVIVVMGVAGAGKTLVGRLLAARLGWEFRDADEVHDGASIAKLRQGEALTDEDREPWLARLREIVGDALARGANLVLACSALKRTYRALLRSGSDHVVIVYLRVRPPVLAERLERRAGHFMAPSLLESQLETLEEPIEAIWIDGEQPPDEIVMELRERLTL
jgi:gluconokinase